MNDFKDFTPTSTELNGEIEDTYNYESIYGLNYKRVHNYLIYSVYEFQYFLVKKERNSGHMSDPYGIYARKDILVRKKYIGFLKNFTLSDN